MPPKKKQSPKNGFFYFMQDFKNRQGRNLRSMQEVAEAAGPHWAKMSKEERRPYEEKSSKEKNNFRASKLTSEGLDVEELEMEDKREHQKIQAMKEEINFNLRVSAKSGRIHKEMFFIIHVNIFCYCASQNRYYPAEIAIVGFTLDEGVKEDCVFHRIIKPGPLPLGYACEANMHSKETHQLPAPMTGDTECNLEQVYHEMREFLLDNSSDLKHYPVLYTEEKMMKMVQQVLDTMSFDFEEQDNQFKVYNLQYMFKVLRNSVAGDIVWPTDTYSIREIEKDVNAHTRGISCEFHDNTNVPVHCSRSVVIRYAYTICDNCCPDLQIALVPGKHVPENSRLPSLKSSSMLSLDSQSSHFSTYLKPTTRDDDTESVVSLSSKSEWDEQSTCTDVSSSFGPDRNNTDNYPPLRDDVSRNSWKTSSVGSNVSSTKSSRSYAGVMGPSGLSKKPAVMPSSLCGSFDKVSINDSASENSFTTDYPVLGRGRGRRPRN